MATLKSCEQSTGLSESLSWGEYVVVCPSRKG
jgi:hypothetical protein